MTQPLKYPCFPFILIAALCAAVLTIIGGLFISIMAAPVVIKRVIERMYNAE
jgi:hypothetical protein